jgi:hypothetical protein
MNTKKIQTSKLETVLQNVHPNRRKVLAAMVLAASAGLPCVAPVSASASTIAPAAALVTPNSVASIDTAQVMTWIVNEVYLLSANISRVLDKTTPLSYYK